jgi:phosphoribosylformylglycinamidine synthase subunit PurL
VDLAAEQRLAALLAAGAERELIAAAHDLSDGGLALALAECCLAGGSRSAPRGRPGTGCVIELPQDSAGDPAAFLFSESAARAVVAVSPAGRPAFAALCAEHYVPAATIGVTGGDALELAGLTSIGLGELSAAHRQTLPALFG